MGMNYKCVTWSVCPICSSTEEQQVKAWRQPPQPRPRGGHRHRPVLRAHAHERGRVRRRPGRLQAARLPPRPEESGGQRGERGRRVRPLYADGGRLYAGTVAPPLRRVQEAAQRPDVRDGLGGAG